MNREQLEALLGYIDLMFERHADTGGESLNASDVVLARQRVFDTVSVSIVPQSGMVFDVQSGRGFCYQEGLVVNTKELVYRGRV
jgi:hypothetical protein